MYFRVHFEPLLDYGYYSIVKLLFMYVQDSRRAHPSTAAAAPIHERMRVGTTPAKLWKVYIVYVVDDPVSVFVYTCKLVYMCFRNVT